MDLEKIVALGCQLGLSGAELRKWVAQKEKDEKEKAQRARQAAREEAERAEREREKEFQRQLQLERVKAERQEKARQAEAEREEKARKAELEILKMRLEIQWLKAESSLDVQNAREKNSGLNIKTEETKQGQDSSGSEGVDLSAIHMEETPPERCENAPLQTSKVDYPTGDAELEDSDNIPVVDVVMMSGPNALDESAPDIAGRGNEENVVFSEDTSRSTLSVQEDPVRESELAGQISDLCVDDSSRSQATDSTVKVEVPVRSGAAHRGESSPYESVGDDLVALAVEAKPPAVTKEEPAISEPGLDASNRGEAVLAVTRAPEKAKLAHFRCPKSAAPTMEPHRKKRSAERQGKSQSLKTGHTKFGQQRNCRTNERTVDLERKRKRVCQYYTHRAGAKEHRSVNTRGKAREGIAARRSDARLAKGQTLKHFRRPGIAGNTKEFVASRDIWKRTSPKKIPQAQLRKRPIDTG